MNLDQLPPQQQGPKAWRAHDMADAGDWTWVLDESEVDEILGAVAALGLDHKKDWVNPTNPVDPESPVPVDPVPVALFDLTVDSFALPTVGPKLAELRQELIEGRGFALISGLPVSELTELAASVAFMGIGTHLGSARPQNANGDLLGHVRNVGLDAQDPNVRIYQTNQRQTFHTDSTDVVGLLCLETAASGGESLLVSASTIYNAMVDRAPDLAAALFEPVATDRRGEIPEGQLPFFTIPILNWFDDQLTVIYQRQYIDSTSRFSQAPRPTQVQIDAMDMFDELANDPALHLTMGLRVGDMQFVHNHSLLHDRTGFTDKPGSPRHLLRLWLSVPGDRALPEVFSTRYGSVTVGDRGGIRTGEAT